MTGLGVGVGMGMEVEKKGGMAEEKAEPMGKCRSEVAPNCRGI